jgi:hypothetical protein
MTLKEVIDFVDGTETNAYSNEQKTVWVSECEGMVHTEARLLPPESFSPLIYEEDWDKVLTVKPPHDKLYRDYLQARIHFANGEYERYANSMALFNSEWGEFVRWYARVYEPTDRYAGNR